MPVTSSNAYDPATVNIDGLAQLLMKLSPEQREALELRLNPEALKQLEGSKADIEAGDTVPMDEW